MCDGAMGGGGEEEDGEKGVGKGKWGWGREERQKEARRERGRKSSWLGTADIPQGHAPSDLLPPTWLRPL